MIDRQLIEAGVHATIKDGRIITLECQPGVKDARAYLRKPEAWGMYSKLRAAAIPFDQLTQEAQRTALLAVFKDDFIDERGWVHTVRFAGEDGFETRWTLCQWLTGNGTDYRKVKFPADYPKVGQQVVIPAHLLLAAMKVPTRRPLDFLEPAEKEDSELVFGSDREGPYALYKLKQGEALYTSVVVRFTDYRENPDILRACDTIQKRSGIKNVRSMKPGQAILIPQGMLSDRFLPRGSEARREYEEALLEASRLRKQRVRTKDLEGVVVILDPGHGGRDRGTDKASHGLYEDELNYDIACRVKHLLESKTNAKVYMTVRDRSLGFKRVGNKRFVHDDDEYLQTTPPRHLALSNTPSLNLRWMLANSLYDREVKRGVDERKIVFTSIHTDWLFNEKLRGAMVYIPGAKGRKSGEKHKGRPYSNYAEGRSHGSFASTARERRRDEALSRNFAQTFLKQLGTHDPPIRRHKGGDPIRSQIRRGRRAFVPAVIRNNKVPTKVLIETANLANRKDREHLANAKWRQWFAEAYVDALKEHFGS